MMYKLFLVNIKHNTVSNLSSYYNVEVYPVLFEDPYYKDWICIAYKCI